MQSMSLDQFRAHFRGQIIQPTDADYESARKVYNAMIDKRPRLIAKCADVATRRTKRRSPAGVKNTSTRCTLFPRAALM